MHFSLESFRQQLNSWGQQKEPFFFVVDFELQKPFACKLDEAASENIFYDFRGHTNSLSQSSLNKVSLNRSAGSFEEYKWKFDQVSAHLRYGDSFVTNLTIKTRIDTDHSLREIFDLAKAKYKLFFKNEFIVFSPESFITVDGKKISTYPMKGTIDSSIPNAEEVLLHSRKEIAEHVTIVDLLRNDLSQVAANVSVNRFRYLEKVTTNAKDLWQMSTEISGNIEDGFNDRIGDLLVTLLPAGSVSGAPKKRTLELIRSAEKEARGYYTGVTGYFDGRLLDSAVMIRFIERQDDQYYYRSGGGITTQSNAENEYEEAINKIYVPIG